VSQPYLGECEDGTWESFGTPETLELDWRGQNTLHLGVLYIIRKLLKFKCRKWPRMGHLDICSTSYGKKKGQESNCQFDSRPLKVRNWPDPDACKWSSTHHWKALGESYKFALDLILIEDLSKELWSFKVLGVQIRTVLGLLLMSPGTKKPFGCGCHREAQSILYGGRWWLPLSPGRGEWSESRVACGLS